MGSIKRPRGKHAKPTGAVLYPTITCETAKGGYIGLLSHYQTKGRQPERRVPAAEANASPRPKRRGAPCPLGRRHGGGLPGRVRATRGGGGEGVRRGLVTARPQGNNGGVTGLRKQPRPARRGANEEAVRARARLKIFSRPAGMI
ncbi:hypothetical protein PVAP13_5NG012692 [Panicum virgatum]|uniref:Uncharacterized protein n=1 Tax=Panicum virgatum TaxID=38727 RepID=A0A8T0S9W9_PANVG|nr:hypothetical protein PVAP13_5NG012692 [Panicum virgatum]